MAQGRAQGVSPDGQLHFAVVLTGKMQYPPDVHDLKVFYVSEEMKRRGVEVSWIQLGGRERRWTRDGIHFAVLRAPKRGPFPEIVLLIRLVLYCVLHNVDVVYVDEWLFLRRKPWARLAGQMLLRRVGVKVVMDQRDPFVDWEEASGELKAGTREYGRLMMARSLLLRQTDLVVLPSEAYSDLYASEGFPREKVFGVFRGIDPALFRLRDGPSETRTKMGLDGTFVIGWFGMMHSYRRVDEVIVPLIENLTKDMPNAHVLIGGGGPLLQRFERLEQTEARSSFTMLGVIPYESLPDYVRACDVTLCPVSTDYRFSMHSNWLKIAESVSVGTPVVATRTEISRLDFKEIKGVIWVGSAYESFLEALRGLQENPELIRSEAREQARHFERYTIGETIPRIADRVLKLAGE